MRGDRLLWLLLLGLFGGVVVLAVHHEQGSVAGLDLDQFGSLVAKLSIAIFVGAFAWALFRGRVAESLIAAAFWVVLAAVLAIAYTYRDPLQAVAQRVIGQHRHDRHHILAPCISEDHSHASRPLPTASATLA